MRASRAAAVACALLAAAGAAAGPGSSAAPPTIQAHRGGPLHAGEARLGENTLGAFRLAHQGGWRVELDVRLSRDGVPVVFHDRRLGRATDCAGQVRNRTVAQLRRCTVTAPASTGEPVSTLAEALRSPAADGARWSVELKAVEGSSARRRLAHRTARVLDASGTPAAHLMIMSFDAGLLRSTARRIRSRHRRLRGARLVLLRRRDERNRAAARRAVRAARGVRAGWVGAKWPVSRAYVRTVHARGLRLAVWTSPQNRASHVGAAADAGVDSIITDDPIEAQGELAAWCLRRARRCAS